MLREIFEGLFTALAVEVIEAAVEELPTRGIAKRVYDQQRFTWVVSFELAAAGIGALMGSLLLLKDSASFLQVGGC